MRRAVSALISPPAARRSLASRISAGDMPIPRSAISTIMEPSMVRAALMETVVSGGEYRRELSSSSAMR